MAQIFLNIAEPEKKANGVAVLSAGHRPFFILTALSAVVLIGLWLIALMGGMMLSSFWHAHEMLFGFSVAAIAGFMMAAVPKWTNVDSPIGWQLLMLVLLWVLGRVGMFLAEVDPAFSLLSYADLVFLPVLAMIVARMIVGAKNARNYVVLVILLGVMATNFAYHFLDESNGLRAGIYMVAMLAALIAGRVIPAFTQNALRLHLGVDVACQTPVWTHKAVLVLLSGLVFAQLLDAPLMISGVLSGLAALVLFIRMMGWKSLNSFFDPIVWVLHAAYIWLPIGFGLKALSDLTGLIDPNAALHALTIGGIGMLILAVASRAALGHSGRALKVSRLTVVSYVLVFAAAGMRVLAFNDQWVMASGVLWVIGYGLFAIVYLPILLKPRVDGLPG